MQYHKYRTETFYHLSGNIKFTIGAKTILTRIFNDKAIKVRKNQLHRIENKSPIFDALILEIQRGVCRESDIIRIDDDYGR